MIVTQFFLVFILNIIFVFFCSLIRLLNTFAEENSIADAIFHLNDALKKEVIDLEVFLKVSILIYFVFL